MTGCMIGCMTGWNEERMARGGQVRYWTWVQETGLQQTSEVTLLFFFDTLDTGFLRTRYPCTFSRMVPTAGCTYKACGQLGQDGPASG